MKLLVCLKTYLGDAVMALPMIEALEREHEPIVIQTSETVQQLLQDPIRIRQFRAFEKSHRIAATLKTAQRLRQDKYDAVILVNRSFRAALTVRLAGIPKRIGHNQEGRRWLLTDVVPYDDERFEAETCLDLAKTIGCDGVARPRLTVTSTAKKEARKLLGNARIGVQPGARWSGKQIPLSVLAETVSSLRQDGREVALLGGPEETDLAERLQKILPTPTLSLVGRCNIASTIGLAANLDLLIGGDTGLMHIAAAAGAPTLTVFGPTNWKKWAHRYAPHRMILAKNGQMTSVRTSDILGVTREILGS